jgi:hypothetical protein
LGFCVAALGFSLQDLNFNNAGNVIAEAFRTRKLLESETAKIVQHFKLQQNSPCGESWQTLAGMLQNPPCNVGVLVLQSSLHNDTWTDAGIAAYLNNFCDYNPGPGTCLNAWQAAYMNMTTQCSGFMTQTPLGGGWLGNMTDFVARTVNTLVKALCQKDDSLPFNAPAVTDPLNSSQTIEPANYPFTYRWVQFKNLVGINMTTVNDTVLNWVCNASAKNITKWLIQNAPNQLAVAARQALSFCDTSSGGGFCVQQVRALQAKNLDPNFAASLKSNPTPQNLAYLCNPCVKWGVRLALRIQNLLQMLNSSGFQVAIRDDLQKTVGGLSVSCVKHPNGKYCAELTAPLLSNPTTFFNKFQPCLTVKNTSQACTSDPHDKCQLAVWDLWRILGCCLASLQNALALDPSGKAYVPTMKAIIGSCGLGAPGAIPPTCAQALNIVTFPLPNVAHAYVVAMSLDNQKTMFAQSIGIDALNIMDITCTEQTNKSTVCVVKFFPDDTAGATAFVADFTRNVQNGAVYLPEFDIASMENSSANGGCRLTSNDTAYDDALFSATSVDMCLNGTSPAKYTWNGTACVGICENGVKDGDETDVDCGGTGCARCPLYAQCVTELDCEQNQADPKLNNSVFCKQNCSGNAGACTQTCGGNFAAALIANPLIVLAGLLMTMILL